MFLGYPALPVGEEESSFNFMHFVPAIADYSVPKAIAGATVCASSVWIGNTSKESDSVDVGGSHEEVAAHARGYVMSCKR